jgi:hypothetical protein
MCPAKRTGSRAARYASAARRDPSPATTSTAGVLVDRKAAMVSTANSGRLSAESRLQ